MVPSIFAVDYTIPARSILSLIYHTAEAAETIFLSNLEAGLSWLAVNLPSLWAIFNKTSSEHILASIHWIKSLGMLRSRRSSHASLCHTRVLNAERHIRPVASNLRLARSLRAARL